MASKKKLSENVILLEKPQAAKSNKSNEISLPLQHEELVKLLHDLQLKEIELEVKNEELSKTNSELKRKIRNYSDFFNNSLVAFFNIQNNGIITNVNKTGSELIGFQIEDLRNKNFKDYISQPSKKIFDSMVTELFASRTSQKIQINLINASGEIIHTTIEAITSSTNEYNLTVLANSSERRLKSLAENAPDIIIRFNKDFKVTYINTEVERITGIPSNYYIGKTIQDFAPLNRFHDDWNNTIQLATETRIFQEMEVNLDAKDGIKTYILRVVAENNEDGEIDSFLGIARDISHRKEWENALQESENNFKYAESISHMGSFQHNLKTDDCKWSDEFFRICGFEPQSFKPDINKFLTVIHPEDQEQVVSAMKNAVEFKAGYRHECRILLPQGKIRYVVSAGQIISDTKGELSEIKGAIQDVTELKQIEISLKESEDNLRMLFESMPVGLAISDTRGRIIYGNRKSRILLGISRTELKQGSVDISKWRFVKKDGSEITMNELPNMKVIQENRRIENTEVGIIRDENIITWLNVTAAPMPNPEEILVAFIDISEQIARENQLKELSEKLKELNATKDKFFSIIAHDLKNPFNSILGFSELLLKNFSKYKNDEVERFIGIINSTSQNAYNLLENLLNWSRSQTGTIEFCPQYYNLTEVISTNLEFVENLALKKSIKINFNLNEKYIVDIDKNMIDTVLRNILTNAIKFSYPGGKINISIEPANGFYMVIISDNGIGIEEGNIDKLFRIDSKYSSYGTNQEKGSGLGLIISKEFIEKNKGEIWAKSEFGKGSEFIFTLPMAKQEYEYNSH